MPYDRKEEDEKPADNAITSPIILDCKLNIHDEVMSFVLAESTGMSV